MVHINDVPHDILSIATTVPIVPVVQIFSPTSAVIVAPPATSPAAVACYDTPNWTDAYGQNCAYYAYNGGYRCALWGSDSSSAGGDGAVAVDNCCACGGGGDGDSSSGGARPSPSSGSATTLATTTATTTEGGDNAVVVGTCGKGKGKRGNGICANGKCCSKFGWCGSTPAHCNYTNRPTATASIPTLAPITLLPTTTSPTTILDVIANWESMTYSIDIDWDKLTPGHSKFCGPVIVGGYEIALAMCSPYTECGKTIITDHYGTNGNDCPEGLMCFGDIECMPPPTTTGSHGIMPAITTLVPTIDTTTTVATSSSYCGSTYADAKQECTPSTICDTDDDCIKFATTDDDGDSWGGKSCFTNISCTIGWQNDEDVIIITTAPPTAAFSPSASSNSSGGASPPTTTAGTKSADILLEGIAATSLLEGINDNSASSSTTTAGTPEITNNMKKTNTIIETSTPSITVTTTSPTTTSTTTDITTHSISSLVESTPVFEVDTDDDDVVVIANFQENKIGLTSGIGGLGGLERNNDEHIISGDSNSQEFVPIWPADYSGAADGLLTLNRRQWSSVGIMLLAAVLCRW